MEKVQITSVVVCDDIRKEITGKDILIGVYSGDIVVPDIPIAINIAFWIELLPTEPGTHRLELRLRLASKEDGLPLKVDVQVQDLSPAAIVTPQAGISIDAETDLLLERRIEDGWQILKSKRIYKGETVQPFSVSNEGPIPSQNP